MFPFDFDIFDPLKLIMPCEKRFSKGSLTLTMFRSLSALTKKRE